MKGLLQRHTKQVSWSEGVAEMNKWVITGMPLFKRGKVRDFYDLGDRLLIVALDRVSCSDVVLPTKIHPS